MAEELKSVRPDVEIQFIRGAGGAFEIRNEKGILFSKLREGRFPEVSEILSRL